MLIELFLIPAYYFVPADVDRLIVETQPAHVSVASHDAQRDHLRLPDLDFPVRIVARCGSGRKPEILSISIADTRVSFDGESLSDGVLDTSIIVPSRQIAPIAVDGFCNSADTPSQPLLLATALTAQVSLRCVREQQRTIVFRARALDVLVSCEPETAQE